MPFKMIDGKLVKVDDDGNPIDSTTNTVPLEQEDNQGTETVNENVQEDVDPREDIFLTEVKKDALNECNDEKMCEKIFKYDGKQTFKEGNLRIYSITDVDTFED